MPPMPGGPRQVASAAGRVLQEAGLAGARVVVGLSGGLDSVVLLHCLLGLAHELHLEVGALHVHHGLSRNADAWARFCAELCARLAVPFAQANVVVERRSALGLEAAARQARYAVFRQQQADAVALAHHRDDQAETLLLQLLRGAGVRGMSAMPAVRALEPASGLRLVRPLLHLPRPAIHAYAREHGLSWVEDESNADPRFDRNFLRTRIFPELAARFPGVSDTLGRAAHNLADAAQLVDELAGADARGVLSHDSLRLSALASLSPARARNLLRWFVERQGFPASSRDQLEEGLRQALAARGDARLQVKLGSARLRRHRGRLYLEPAGREPARGWSLAWSGERELALPAGLGLIRFEPAVGTGLSLERLHAGEVVVRARTGGERIRVAPSRPSRTLKNLLQESGVPEWQRDRLPLLFVGDSLVWVPGVGEDCRYAAAAGEDAVMVRWECDA